MGAAQKVLEVIIRAKDETSKAVRSAEGNLSGLGGLSVGGIAAAGAGAALAVGAGLNAAADGAQSYGSQIVAIQRMTGATAADSSKLAAVFARLGIDATGGGRMIKTLDAAIAGNSKTLLGAGIATKDSTGHNRTSIAVLRDLANYYSTATDKTKATADVSKLLGKNWQTALPFLAGGAKTMDTISAAAQKNGQIMSQEQLSSVTKSAAAWKDLQAVEKGVTTQIGLAIIPIRTFVAQGLMRVIEWVRTDGPKILGWFKQWGPTMLMVSGPVGFVVGYIITHWKQVSAFFAQLWTQIKPFFDAFVNILMSALLPAWNSLKKAWADLWPVLRPMLPELKKLGMFLGGALLIAILAIVGVIALMILGFAKFIQFSSWVFEKVTALIHVFSDFFNAIPDGAKQMVAALTNPIGTAVDMLSKLNPFVRHSPSLVDNVLAGVGVIKGAYGSLSGMNIAGPSIGGIGAGSLALSGAGRAVSGRADSHIHVYLDGKELNRAQGKLVTSTSRSGAR